MNSIDKLIIDFLNWKEETPGSFYHNDGTSNSVVYSIHNNYPYQDLPFLRDWNWMMYLLEKINATRAAGIKARDIPYTIKYLLNGGYFPGSNGTHNEKLPFSLLNLYTRIGQYLYCLTQQR